MGKQDTDARPSGEAEQDDKDIPALADEQRRHLTPIEELVEDLSKGREVYDYQIIEAVENVKKIQKNANKIERRFEGGSDA